MTPKEKAEELIDKMCDYKLEHEDAKRCALIAVDEIMKAHSFDKMYWEEVKQEIEKL